MTSEILGRVTAFRDKAVEHGIPLAEVDRWIRTVRPCANLEPDGDGPVVAQLGGNPMLPLDAPYPRFPHIASVDCAVLPREATDLALPSDGHLLFFTDPDEYDSEGEVMYVPAGTAVAERHGHEVFPHSRLRPTIDLSPPSYPVPTAEYPHTVDLEDTWWATYGDMPSPASLRIGGYPRFSNNEEPPLLAAAVPAGGAGTCPEAAQDDWVLLASWNAHDIVEVPDRVTVHWVIPREDLAVLRFDRVHAIADLDC